VPTRLGETHVLVTGPEAGQPLVLFHGWNTNAGGWWPQINDLKMKDLQVGLDKLAAEVKKRTKKGGR
jgi:pimeloyl-ACP methyl ester carboxylesterase